MIAIGIDTGSTSTDAVIYDLDRKKILSFAKTITTHENLAVGIREVLRQLPAELKGKALYLSLSTTLATNACVENKGADICLIFIGASRKAVEWTLSSYGFESMDFMRFMEGNAAAGTEPDWNALDRMLPEITARYDGIALAQIAARENDGLYEKQAAERIRNYKDIPVTCSYEIFRELNVIKRGAGALLNARIAPEIKAFFAAVHQVLDEEGADLPVFIMRSDGSLVSENYTLKYPVETLVCGPTASAKGAIELFHEQQAVVVDMGGTTSDMAILRNGQPKIDDEGIRLAGWQTFVKGISIETTGLGGDSRLCYKAQRLWLDSRRVMPVSILASRHPEVLPELERVLTQYPKGSFLPLYEHFISVHTNTDGFYKLSEQDTALLTALKNAPLSITQLADALGISEYHLSAASQEQKGLILRCGFTPTDAILLKGDRKDSKLGAYGKLLNSDSALQAARMALSFIANSTGHDPEWILDEIYRQVKETLYRQIIKLLWRDSRDDRRTLAIPDELENMAKEAFSQAMDPSDVRFYKTSFSTDAVLLGIGAPIHIFLPDVAKALHTDWRVSEYSGVSNALGAMLGNVCTYETVHIRTDYIDPKADTGSGPFIVYTSHKEAFEEMEDAVARAQEAAGERAVRQAKNCGAAEIISITYEIKMKEGNTRFGSVNLGADVTACARGKLQQI